MSLVPSSAIAANDPPAGGLEPTTFGGRMIFLGLGVATIISDATCVFAPQDAPPPDTRCVAIPPAPSAITSDFQDIGSIYLPKGSARSIVWPTLTYNIDYQFNNTTGAPSAASIAWTRTLRSKAMRCWTPHSWMRQLASPITGRLEVFSRLI